jgi:RNA polymerase sigma factor (sigma-70 family)
MLQFDPRTLHWGGLEEIRADLRRFLAPRCRDESEIDDVVQETLLRAAVYRERLEEPDKLRPWAQKIASNVLCDRVRRECRIDRVAGGEAVLETLPAREANVCLDGGNDELEVCCEGRVLDKRTALDLLARELRGLRREDRELLSAFYGGGGSCRAAGLACDVPRSRVKVRLFRARRRLLKAIRHRLAMMEAVGPRVEA